MVRSGPQWHVPIWHWIVSPCSRFWCLSFAFCTLKSLKPTVLFVDISNFWQVASSEHFTLWLFNIAMENGPCIYLLKMVIFHGDVSHNQRVKCSFCPCPILHSDTFHCEKSSGCRASIATMEECFNAEFVSLHVSPAADMTWGWPGRPRCFRCCWSLLQSGAPKR